MASSRKAATAHDAMAFWADHRKHYIGLADREMLHAAAIEQGMPITTESLAPTLVKMVALKKELAAIYLELGDTYNQHGHDIAAAVEGQEQKDRELELAKAKGST